MDARGARAHVARMVGNTTMFVGLLIALLEAWVGIGPSIGPWVFAGLFVIIGVGLRLEAAILDRH
ncbi:hypothetical protein KZ829_08635 [Actinoplanes hulinensis]|uniref:Uncharacterized protein n=2 Tax=Actinoplanes TaxID=1865 RepID=A0A7W5ACQ0_9ACTN|nr:MULTISPECIES: hypothetical protein [Actinoplanes]MBB3093872.1 hypothetical protein [Actinoplanes campanulatus]MBW6433801.1 hypothetical protein [Actinoplanes hulinensis]GGN06219.1 hypothetical protein GCM10010109_13900 [Actinoplanes campanulatus]GID35055.1 hypothetical protein Aca09nite_15610 [Actinoplanes campanulatus]